MGFIFEILFDFIVVFIQMTVGLFVNSVTTVVTIFVDVVSGIVGIVADIIGVGKRR